ncbi:MAG: patatin-like phospholipase family protein [Neisseria sp.]|uniref:patatin-like phospholipase family protein n=1 Tax=Neisseria sp. TaxID=192066 RepID=UPI0026DB5069|nr:patatin-like phospholipase family protein [Neisseria sp.]MDO4640288.1 patatin-like phospholipase family protein [Neisseria sp.]
MKAKFTPRLVKIFLPAVISLLSACNLVKYQPLTTINKIDTSKGYRLENNWEAHSNDTYIVLMFSGGGTRAAALGYGVLEELNKQKVWIGGKESTLLDNIDSVSGVSGGSVLAAYFSLYGKDAIPSFERRFLKQNFERQVTKQVFSFANLPRLTSNEYGRGDLLQEQFENTLFKKATFGDLEKHRKGPFAIISATDMSLGQRIDFTQERFDSMCLNLSDLRISRAVAASSAVPLVFAPITLNNNGGNCGYTLPANLQEALAATDNKSLQNQTRREMARNFMRYADSKKRPFIHLIDGGLTDNLGLRGLLDRAETFSGNALYNRAIKEGRIKKIVIINVNAQNQLDSRIDHSPAIPGLSDVLSAVVNIPIDQYSQESLRRIRTLADQWNEVARTRHDQDVGMYFISLNLLDLPDSPLRKSVLNIPTSFYLPHSDINNLKQAAHVLLQQSPEYARLLKALTAKPTDNKQLWFIGEPDTENTEEAKEAASSPSTISP